ncbi:MAG: universal stress protein [Bacteroidia bacterium]
METIIVPTDFSAPASNAVNYALGLAEFFDAKIILVNATPILMPGYDTALPIEMMAQMQKQANDALEDLKNEILAKPHRKITIDCYTAVGYAFDVIENAAKKFNADLIVMGITGEAGVIKEHIIGSTAVRVSRDAMVPVFIVPESIKYKRIRKIAFACDLERIEENNLLYVVKYFSRLFDAELEMVYVESPYEEISDEKAKSNLVAERTLEHVRHKTTYVTHSDVAQGLQDYFETNPSDVVMLNPKKHNIFHRLFLESITNKLAFHLHQPILAIR